MRFRTIRLMALAAAIGVVADRIYLERRKPATEQFPLLRRRVNETVNPWLLEHHIPGSEKAEIGTLEHVGRTSGAIHLTPVHPTLRDETVLIPAPLGVGSQWAQNVLHAGRARLQLHETLYELDSPALITVSETGFFGPAVAIPFDRLGWRYVRMHVAARAPGAFPAYRAAPESAQVASPILDLSAEIPVEPMIPIEPKMVEGVRSPA